MGSAPAVAVVDATPESPTMRRRIWKVLGLIALAALAADHIGFVSTPSIPYRVVFYAWGTPHRGDYLSVTVHHRLIERDKPELLTKQLACGPGDTLRFADGVHTCNGQVIDHILLSKLEDGTPVPPFQYDGVIPEGQGFLLGTHPRSLDSRYLGLFPIQGARKVWGLF